MSTFNAQQHMAGLDPEPRVTLDVRVWFAAKLALWRSKTAWGIAVKQAADIVSRCRHAPGCDGVTAEIEPCRTDCPDREIRMSALVILNAARQFAPVGATKPADQPYSPPSREYFSATVAELGAAQAELEVLRGTVVTAPPQDNPKQLERTTT